MQLNAEGIDGLKRVAWTQTGKNPLAFEYRDAGGVLWRAEQGAGGHYWRLTADGVADETRTWMDLREIRLHVEGGAIRWMTPPGA